jgi:voltage-gated potassium channel Kch
MPEEKQEEIKTLITWTSPLRVFIKRDKKHFTNLILVVFLISLVLIFFREFLLVGVILALVFVAYVNSSVEPPEFEHKITTKGITSGGHTYLWGDLKDFWLVERGGRTVLNVDTKIRFPGRLFIVLNDDTVEEIKQTLSKYLSLREEQKMTGLDRLTDWFSQKLQL